MWKSFFCREKTRRLSAGPVYVVLTIGQYFLVSNKSSKLRECHSSRRPHLPVNKTRKFCPYIAGSLPRDVMLRRATLSCKASKYDTLNEWWLDVGPTFNQHCFKVLCLLSSCSTVPPVMPELVRSSSAVVFMFQKINSSSPPIPKHSIYCASVVERISGSSPDYWGSNFKTCVWIVGTSLSSGGYFGLVYLACSQSKQASQPASTQASQPASKHARTHARKPASQPASQQAIKQSSKQASKQASKKASKQERKQASKKANKVYDFRT